MADEALSAIMELSIPGMKVEASTVREYNTKYAAHILGYVGPMNEKQYEQYKNNPDYSMDSEIGQTGFEAAFEQYLHGVDAWRIDEITVDGTILRSYYMDGIPPRAEDRVAIAQKIIESQVIESTSCISSQSDCVCRIKVVANRLEVSTSNSYVQGELRHLTDIPCRTSIKTATIRNDS